MAQGNRKHLETWELRDICCKHKWFTGGSNESYEKLFKRCEEGADFKELALIIWVCTPEWTHEEIYEVLLQDRANMIVQGMTTEQLEVFCL